MTRKTAFLFVAITACTVGATLASDTKTFSYERFGEVAAQVAAASKYDQLLVRVKLTVADGSIAPDKLVFTIPHPAGDIVLRPAADGVVELPYSAELKARNPMVATNVPADLKLKMSVDVQLRPPPQATFPYALLARGVAQANALVKEQAGAMSWFAPSVTRLLVKCGSDCSAMLSGATARIAAGKDGTIALPLVEKPEAALMVTLSRPAQSIMPVME